MNHHFKVKRGRNSKPVYLTFLLRVWVRKQKLTNSNPSQEVTKGGGGESPSRLGTQLRFIKGESKSNNTS